MKVFQELTIQGDSEALRTTIQRVTESLCSDWYRDEESERRLSAISDQEMYCFCCSRTEERPGGCLWMMRSTAESLVVSNIVPTGEAPLDLDEYNHILREFHSRFVKPAAAKGTDILLTEDHVPIEKWLTANTARHLREFSATARRPTGFIDLQHLKRWHEFIVAVHREGSRLDARTLQRLLEGEGWDEAAAQDLAEDYELGRSVLAVSDETR